MRKNIILNGSKAMLTASVLALLVVGCRKEDSSAPETVLQHQALKVTAGEDRPHVPNELIVKFKASTSNSKRDEVLARIGGQVQERIITGAMKHNGDNEGITLIHTNLDALDAIGRIKAGEEIVYAEPNYLYSYDATSSDPYFTNGSLWGMNASNTNGSQASTAWAAGHTGSASVFVGIIDEGIQYTHPDLAGQIWTNPYDPIDGVDNDGNGYVDDTHGWDFDGNDNTIYDGGTRGSLDNHGTHVSGTIGAKANTQGVVGMNWNVTIISTKFLGRRGGTTANAVKAVDYLTDLKTRHGINLVASNNSWGGGGSSQALSDAITRANTADILFIAAAGNGGSDGAGDNNDNSPSYPSNYPQANVIAVAATTSTGGLASFSNYGATQVDLGAPGQGIWSTVAYNSYSSYSGTSMATPHVTGAAALYAAYHPGSTAAQIKAAILGSTTPTASLTGKCVTGGRLNVSGF
jgi:subtilisin family serine protease